MTKFATIFLSFICVCSFWAPFDDTGKPGFRGVNIYDAHKDADNRPAIDRTVFCSDLPMCLRPVVPNLVNLSSKFVGLIEFVGNRDHLRPRFANAVGQSAFILTVWFLIFFVLLSYLPLGSMVLTAIAFSSFPLSIKPVGAVLIDGPILLLWASVIGLLFRKHFVDFEEPLDSKRFLLIALFTIFATWTMENTGFAVGIATFVFLILHRKTKLALQVAAFIGTVSLLALATGLVFAYQNSDVFWVFPDHNNPMYTYELYGTQNSVKNVVGNLWRMSRHSIFIFSILFGSLLLIGNPANLFHRRSDWLLLAKATLSCLVGFCATIVGGYFVSGLAAEATRQFLPFTFMLTFLLAIAIPPCALNVRRLLREKWRKTFGSQEKVGLFAFLGGDLFRRPGMGKWRTQKDSNLRPPD